MGTPLNECTTGLKKITERALQTIIDGSEQTWAQLRYQRGAGTLDRFTNANTGSILIDLDRRQLSFEPNDLAD